MSAFQQVEDLIDDIEAFVNAAAFLKSYGAKKIYVLATHGVLSSDVSLLEQSSIDEVRVQSMLQRVLKLIGQIFGTN